MLYWCALGVVLHESLSPKGGWHRPWKRLSGVRFSWNMTTTCIKGVGNRVLRVSWAWAGAAPEQASTRRRYKPRGMRFIFPPQNGTYPTYKRTRQISGGFDATIDHQDPIMEHEGGS